MDLDETGNSYSFVGNNENPFEIILDLASKSTFAQGNPGFFFYETRDGHYFKSIDTLIDQKPVAIYFRNDFNRSSVSDNSNDFKIYKKTANSMKFGSKRVAKITLLAKNN